MGSAAHIETKQEREEREERNKRRVEEIAASMSKRRLGIGERVAMVIVDLINARVIRPGPVNEERECYDMAQDLLDLKPEIAVLVSGIIEVDETGTWRLNPEKRWAEERKIELSKDKPL